MNAKAMRNVLILIGALNLALALYMWISPSSFFENVGSYGVRNDHYIGDVAAFYAAWGLALIFASTRPSWQVPLLAVGALWYGFHAVNHAFTVSDASSDARGIADAVSLALGAILLAWLARVASRLRSDAETLGVGVP